MAATVRTAKLSTIHVITAAGNGEPLITGEVEPLPVHAGEDGGYIRAEDVYVALAKLLREMADDLEALAQ